MEERAFWISENAPEQLFAKLGFGSTGNLFGVY
jgi:hypothetical protein